MTKTYFIPLCPDGNPLYNLASDTEDDAWNKLKIFIEMPLKTKICFLEMGYTMGEGSWQRVQ